MSSQAVGVGTNAPAASSIVDIQSTNKGMLLPRMTTMQRKDIVNPVAGLMVFDLDKQTVYIHDGTKWNPMLMTYTDTRIPLIPREASDGLPDDQLGYSVSINGNYAIVGAYRKDVSGHANQGGAYIFFRNNGTWTQQAILISSDGLADDFFGWSVSMGDNADYAIVGAKQATIGANAQQGAAYIFSRSGAVWTQLAKLTASDGAASDNFGQSVSMDADYVIIGASGYLSATGAAYIFQKGAGWMTGQAFQAKLIAIGALTGDTFGSDVSISGDQVVVGAPGFDLTPASQAWGACYIFARAGTVWTQKARIIGPGVFALFGSSVAIDGDYVLSGAPFYNSQKGQVHAFYKGTGWVDNQAPQLIITASDAVTGDSFGTDVSLSNDQALIGAPGFDFAPGTNQGAAYLYKRTGITWPFQRKFDDESKQSGENFGNTVSIDGFNIIFGIALKNSAKGEIQMINIE